MSKPLRIGILGFDLESNRFAPPCGARDFAEKASLKGEEITREARADSPSLHGCLVGFYRAMDASGRAWEPVPIRHEGSQPAGPVEQGYFDEIVADVKQRLTAAGPLDGVFSCSHGAAVATGSHDPDGDFLTAIRATVGPGVPLIATLDLHANISDAMVGAADILVAFLTNPHVDQLERGAEAARHMIAMADGMKPVTAHVKLPLVPPSTTLLTAEGHPYGDVIRAGQAMLAADPELINVSVLAGFAFSDTPMNGMSFVVTARSDGPRAEAAARKLADDAWADRARYRTALTALDDAVDLARQAMAGSRPPVLLADVADNPGGGGRGNTMYILEALHRAGVENALLAPVHDPALVAEAMETGVGGRFTARFNRDQAHPMSLPFEAPAVVEALSDGTFVGRYGLAAERTIRLGRTAILRLGDGGLGEGRGISVVVISLRQQCFSTDYFDAFGLDCAAAKTVVVKSRGHFRAGFQHLFPPDRIFEVDVPGLTSPNLATFEWRYLPRPVYPLDEAV